MTVQGFNWHLWIDDAILCAIMLVLIRCHNLALFLVILTLLLVILENCVVLIDFVGGAVCPMDGCIQTGFQRSYYG